MAEIDAFERRFHAAVRGYVTAVSSDLDPVGLARLIATAEPRRRGWGLAVGRPQATAPRVAWLVLLAALVVLAMAVGLFAGANRRGAEQPALVPMLPPAYTCPAGSTPDEPGPADQARPTVPTVRMAFDRDTGRIVALASVAGNPAAGWATWTFDVCTNTWTGPGPPDPSANGPGDVPDLVYDPIADLVITVGGDGSVATYDVAAGRWTARARAPFASEFGRQRLVHDRVSGLVFAQVIASGDSRAPAQELWTYDVTTDTWNLTRQSGSVPEGTSGDHLLLAYDPRADRIVAVMTHPDRDYTRLFDPRTGEWSTGTTGPPLNTGWIGTGGEIAWDEDLERTVVFSDGGMAAYDATADRWEILSDGRLPDPGVGLGTGPDHRLGHWMVHDPVNGRLVVAGGSYRTADGWVTTGDTWAFDTETREWIELVPGMAIE